jgi:hypothetical protein
MSIKRLACLVAATVILGAGSARAQSPWPGPGTEYLPPDPTVPYLPAIPPLICPNGEPACLAALARELHARTDALGCDHAAVFSDAYLTITQALADGTGTPGFFDRLARGVMEKRRAVAPRARRGRRGRGAVSSQARGDRGDGQGRR